MQLLPPLVCHDPSRRVGVSRLRLVVTQVEGNIGKRVALLGFRDERVDQVTQEPLVLGLAGETLTRHADDVGVWVVARANELDEGISLGFCKVLWCEISGTQLDNNLGFGGVLFTHVCGIAKTEEVGFRG